MARSESRFSIVSWLKMFKVAFLLSYFDRYIDSATGRTGHVFWCIKPWMPTNIPVCIRVLEKNSTTGYYSLIRESKFKNGTFINKNISTAY